MALLGLIASLYDFVLVLVIKLELHRHLSYLNRYLHHLFLRLHLRGLLLYIVWLLSVLWVLVVLVIVKSAHRQRVYSVWQLCPYPAVLNLLWLWVPGNLLVLLYLIDLVWYLFLLSLLIPLIQMRLFHGYVHQVFLINVLTYVFILIQGFYLY